jgi:hypothetical protein
MRPSDSDSSLLRLLPPIRRARLWRLYAQDGRRFLDLWMDAGRSLLGAKGLRLGTSIKSSIDMGLLRPLPSVWEGRAKKALMEAFPGFSGAVAFRNEERALRGLGEFLGLRTDDLALLDVASRDAGERLGSGRVDALVVRPFGERLLQWQAAVPRFALPLLPCPSALAPGIVLVRDARDLDALRGELAPPASLACAAGALRELAAFSRIYGEELWRRSDRRLSPFFERRGPYLYPRCAESEYEGFFRSALAAGILVSPRFELPSILPADFDDGELAALARNEAPQPRSPARSGG